MAITWNILGMDVLNSLDGNSDVVTNVFWYCSDSDADGNYGFSFGNQQLNTDNITDFVDYNTLTESQVIQWVKDGLTADGNLDSVEQSVAQGVEQGLYTLRHQGVPW